MTVQSQTAFDVLKQWLLRGSGKFAEAPGNIVLSLPWVPSRLCFTSFRTSLADWDDLGKGRNSLKRRKEELGTRDIWSPQLGWGKARELAPIPRAATIGALPEPDRLEGMSWEPTCSKLTYSLLGVLRWQPPQHCVAEGRFSSFTSVLESWAWEGRTAAVDTDVAHCAESEFISDPAQPAPQTLHARCGLIQLTSWLSFPAVRKQVPLESQAPRVHGQFGVGHLSNLTQEYLE